MASVIPDLITDSGLERDRTTFRIMRSFWVRGLTGEASAIIPNALAATGIPVFGQGHPVYTSIPAASFQVRPVRSQSMAQVIVTYELKTTNGDSGGSTVLVEYDGGLATEMVSTDKNGNPIVVKWFPDKAGAPGVFKHQTAYVPIARPTGQLKVTRFVTLADESDSTIDNYVLNYQGRVNSGSWRGRPKWSWLCSNIHVSQLSWKQYKVIFQFDWKPLINGGTVSGTRGNWVADCAFLLAENGGHPPGNFVKDDNPANANAYRMAEVYPEADFSGLGF